jgi:hypothetical protein
LAGIIQQFELKLEKPTDKQLLSALQISGFKIELATLRRDKAELESKNNFVLNLAQKSYSHYIDDCFKLMDFAEHEAREILKTEWRKNKTVKTTGDDGVSKTVTITGLEAGPKLAAITQLKQIAKDRYDMLNGKSLKVGVTYFNQHVKKLEKELANANSKLEEAGIKIEA